MTHEKDKAENIYALLDKLDASELDQFMAYLREVCEGAGKRIAKG